MRGFTRTNKSTLIMVCAMAMSLLRERHNSVSILWSEAKLRALIVGISVMMSIFGTSSARAQVYTVLHSFAGGADGATPYGSLMRGSNGSFYGTTFEGGTSGLCSGQGCGVVYKLNPAGNYKVLHAFTGRPNDGGAPFAELIMDKRGSLYGTTNEGGTNGSGTVFKVFPNGNEIVLHSFNGTDGQAPYAGLLRDAGGNLYSTTNRGGTFDSGVVFKLSTSGIETVLYSFNYADGHFPTAGLVRVFGNLYGTTNQGGAYGYGAAFKLNAFSRRETVIHSFTGGSDGEYPQAGLIVDGHGNLYGSAYGGVVGGGGGVVFKLNKAGETVLYSFSAGSDGTAPGFGYLVRDATGNLYGVTNQGGDFSCSSYGCGTVFKVDPNGVETVLHAFKGGTDGQYPNGGVIRDQAGNLYGTTNRGGAYGYGTVFKITP
jgi:uncharacterized repeat protein (TIGR03803 family)